MRDEGVHEVVHAGMRAAATLGASLVGSADSAASAELMAATS